MIIDYRGIDWTTKEHRRMTGMGDDKSGRREK